MRNIMYSEWVPAGTLVKTLVGFLSSLVSCVLLIVIAVGVAIQNPLLIVVLVSILAIVLILFWNYRGIQIQVTDNELSINYGFFNHKHIPISNIVSCKHTKTSLSKYGGAGVRYCFTDCSWAYTTSFGDAVKIIRRKENPSFSLRITLKNSAASLTELKNMVQTDHFSAHKKVILLPC